MRRLAFTDKKVRGVRRRLRALEGWAAEFCGWLPASYLSEDTHVNFRIPVLSSLVQGKQASFGVRKKCAQCLIDACENLLRARPEEARSFPVVAAVCLPDMFASGVCIYANESSLRQELNAHDEYASTTVIHERSLAKDWGLILPPGFRELGLFLDYRRYGDGNDWYACQLWYLGEVPEASSEFACVP